MATLVVTPNPASVGQTVSVTGTGYLPHQKTQLLLDGVVTSIGMFRNEHSGSFTVTITVSATPKTQTVQVQQATPRGNKYILMPPVATVVVQGATAVPTVPLNFAGVAGNTQVQLSWSAPVSDGGSAITSYRVYKNGAFLHNPTGLTYTAHTLINGTSYTFAVSAVNANGEGPKTAAISKIPFAPPAVPSAPLNLIGTGGNTQVTLTWSPPASNGGAAITNYKLYRGGVLIASPTTTSYLNTGLTNGTTYTYQVSAVNSVGEGPKSISDAATPTGTPPPTGTVVTSPAAMMAALDDLSVREIIVQNGTYPISWFDINGASHPNHARTAATAVIVRAATTGGVTFDAQGTMSVHQLFRNGAAYQEWRGFKYANSHPYNNGVLQFGEGNDPVDHITLKDIEFTSSIIMDPGPGGNYRNGQGIYFSWATRGTAGNHHILIDGFTCNSTLWSAIHIYHDSEGDVGHDNTIRNMTVGTNMTMGIVSWAGTIYNYTFENITTNGVGEYGVRHSVGGTNLVFKNVVTSNSGSQGIYSDKGTYPNIPGCTFIGCTFG